MRENNNIEKQRKKKTANIIKENKRNTEITLYTVYK